MKKTWKPILSLLLALCITVSTAAGAIAIGRASAADGAANWLLKNVAVDPADQEPDNIVDWAAFALARGGYQLMGIICSTSTAWLGRIFAALFKRLCAYRAGGCRGGRRCPQCGRA